MNKLEHTELMKMGSIKMPNSHYRAMLAYICPKCYLEVFSPQQSGIVKRVLRNKYGIPVCVEVESGGGGKDYISLDSVDFFEPYDEYPSDMSEYESISGDEEWLVGN